MLLKNGDRISRKTIDGLVLDVAPERKEKIVAGVVQEWIEQGIKRGIEQGYKKGMAEGEARLLTKLLERHFGPLPDRVKKQIEKADADTLENWGERIINAPDLDAVFEEH